MRSYNLRDLTNIAQYNKFNPELLFDEVIADRLKEHPMVLWKMMSHK